jgi:hypothetical protein
MEGNCLSSAYNNWQQGIIINEEVYVKPRETYRQVV